MSAISDKFHALKAATPHLRHTTATERTARLQSLWEGIVDRKQDLFDAGAQERGCHELDIAAELVMIKGEIDFAVKNMAKWMKPQKVKNSLNTMGKRCEIHYQPKGVVLNLSAFNAPTAECIVPMIAAIAAGNAVAIKPSELAPISAQIIEEIIHKAIPRDEAEVFQGGVEVAQELLSLPFNHIYYTGGASVGKVVMKAAADHFATVTLEMGGKNPVIVDKSADLENAATKIAWGRVMNAGQVCIAPDYAIVHEDVMDRFLDLLKTKIQALYNADNTGMENSQYVPRIINERHLNRIKGLMDDAIAKGAKLVCGGNSDVTKRFIEPTILTQMSDNMDIMKEEVFGPILSVIPYKSQEEIIEILSKCPTPLALYVYATDNKTVSFVLNNTTSGSAVVNNNCIQSGTNPRLPFGGVGQSGMGRIGGFAGFESMSNQRSVVYQPLDKFRDFLIMMPPYSDRYHGLIMKGLKK